MDLSAWLAVLSFLAALLAALYARWASFEARRSNEQAFHTNRIEIYKEFLALKYAILQRGDAVDHEDTRKFFYPHLYSEFFFSSATHEKIKRYFDVCFQMADKSLENDDLAKLKKEERDLVGDVETLIKKELKVAVGRRNWLI